MQLILLCQLHFYLVGKDLNLKKARTIKKNSPVDCFFSEWCDGGYCASTRTVAKQGGLHRKTHPVIPTKNAVDTFMSAAFLFGWKGFESIKKPQKATRLLRFLHTNILTLKIKVVFIFISNYLGGYTCNDCIFGNIF